MKEPTKADLATAVAKLTEENAGLRDLLAAVSEYARSVPLAVGDQRQELRRATETLIHIGVITDPYGAWVWGWGGGQGAARLREHAAKPVDYEVYVKPEPANPPHHAADGERACQAADNRSVGYICTAQDGHSGPDHIAYKPGGGEYHRWPVAAGVTRDQPASPDAAEALTGAIAGNQNMTNKECIARVAHADDKTAAVPA